jgi:hypothetical protein
VQRLADEASTDGPAIRDALADITHDGTVRVQRFMRYVEPADIDHLAEHARITLLIDWSRDADEDDLENDIDLQNLRWSGPPWEVYQNVAEQKKVSSKAVEVLGSLPFAVRYPNGNTISHSFAQAAIEQRISVPAAALAMQELAQHGLLIWNDDRQEVQLRDSQSPGASVPSRSDPDH